MNIEQYQFMTLLPNLTGRLTAQETAWALRFQEGDIPVLVRAGLLKPLGKPSKNAVRYYSATYVRELGKNEAWLAKATRAVYDHWLLKASRRSNRNRSGFDGHSSGSPDSSS